MDVVLLSQIVLVPALALLLLPTKFLEIGIWTLTLWCTAWFSFIVFMECVTPAYIDFFDSRPGRIFFEYLGRPDEISSLIRIAYLPEAMIGLGVPLIAVAVMYKKLRFHGNQINYAATYRLGVLLPLVVILILGARSTFGHRPVNPSTFAVSNDQLINDLLLNSSYKLLYAVYSLRHEGDSGKDYPQLETTEIVKSYKWIEATPLDEYVSQSSTHHRFGNANHNSTQKNIAIVVEESLGARFVGKLGGLPLTPELDKWSEKGIWFTNLYATGIRSARGLEAIVTGFPPSSARSVLKLGLSQQNFYTMANSLSEYGYRSHFIYGGEGHFDNMKGFFLNNGFDDAVDINNFDEYSFRGTWGVSDEDLFNRAHHMMSSEEGRFFTLIFTSSFHSPYEFPKDKIELYEQPQATKNNAVKYADYALGQFLEAARNSSYWSDTVFLIVADHDERPRGDSLVPISSYHIPGLIIAEGLVPRQFDKIASQIDLLPTLLSIANVAGTAPWVGHNLLDLPADYPGRAMMQFGRNHAYMEGQDVIVHMPDRPPAQFIYKNKSLKVVPYQELLGRKALIWALLPGQLYQRQLYSHLPG